MPHAALWVVQLFPKALFNEDGECFNAARGFVGGATDGVSDVSKLKRCFNAARGFVGGATRESIPLHNLIITFQCRTRLCGWCNKNSMLRIGFSLCFNAARGFVGGATASLAALVPLGGESPFGKSPKI